MIYDEKMIALDEALNEMIDQLKQTKEYRLYHQYKEEVSRSVQAQQKLGIMSYYQEQLAYSEYLSKEKTRELKREWIKSKRQYDELSEVIAFHKAEYALSQLLDEVVTRLSSLFSNQIKIHYGNQLNHKGCQGGCHD